MGRSLILVPARMESTRLPGKPLALLRGREILSWVLESCAKLNCGPVVVATPNEEIVQCAKRCGVQSVLTSQFHESGSDRIFEALSTYDPEEHYQTIINIQGDMPLWSDELSTQVRELVGILETQSFLEDTSALSLAIQKADVFTFGARIKEENEAYNENVVKVVYASALHGGQQTTTQHTTPHALSFHKALYFTRAKAPWGAGSYQAHVGLYIYKRASLKRFITLPPSSLEKRERLEQLRLLENDMSLYISLIEEKPWSIDTKQDLEALRDILNVASGEK